MIMNWLSLRQKSEREEQVRATREAQFSSHLCKGVLKSIHKDAKTVEKSPLVQPRRWPWCPHLERRAEFLLQRWAPQWRACRGVEQHPHVRPHQDRLRHGEEGPSHLDWHRAQGHLQQGRRRDRNLWSPDCTWSSSPWRTETRTAPSLGYSFWWWGRRRFQREDYSQSRCHPSTARSPRHRGWPALRSSPWASAISVRPEQALSPSLPHLWCHGH